MSDAREIVQPRWKRRATEIAEAIGGTSSGVSSVCLDSNTITQLSQAIADAIDLKVLDINIKKYDDVNYGTAGMPIQQGYSAVTGNRLPFHVAQQGTMDVNLHEYQGLATGTGNPIDMNMHKFGNTNVTSLGNGLPVIFPVGASSLGPLDVNIKTYNGTNYGTAGMPIQQGYSAVTGNKVPFSVTETNPVSGGGTTTFPSLMDVNIVKFGGGPAISQSSNLPVAINGNAGPVEVKQYSGSNSGPWIVETGVHGGTFGATTLATTVTGTVSVTETHPVSGGGGGGGGLNITDTTTAFKNALYGVGVTANTTVHEQVETAMDSALANATGISVTESAPVTAVKITGDETYGIIMTKTYSSEGYNNFPYPKAPVGDYTSFGYGLGVGLNLSGIQGSNTVTTGWTIMHNGTEIPNQDISNHLRGTTPVPLTIANVGSSANLDSLALSYPRFIPIRDQATVDKYHGRKVILSSVANVWIVEPLTYFDPTNYGVVHWTDNAGNTKFFVIDETGAEHPDQRIYKDKVLMTHSSANAVIGLRVIARRDNTTRLISFWQTIDV